MNPIKKYIITQLRRSFDITSRDVANRVVQELKYDDLALQLLASISPRYIPWTKAALSPSVVVTILNDIMINQRSIIVECGGGISTIYIARLLTQRNAGHLYTIEEDNSWANYLENLLSEEGLTRYVTILQTPITEIRCAMPNRGEWYDETIIRKEIGNKTIDLLIVDGPAVKKDQPLIRYLALPFFYKNLSKRFCIILDDIHRSGESYILKEWEKKFDIPFKNHITYAIGFSGHYFIPYL